MVHPTENEMRHILDGHHKIGAISTDNPEVIYANTIQMIREWDYDVMVELSPLSISEKGEPAITYIREALIRGKHVVTANKGPVAFAFDELHTLALRNHVKFLFEAIVMDGTPVFNLVRETLKGCQISQVSGILNSTTNFIISSMEEGESFDYALRVAQKEGITERDPSYDIEGWDAAAKIAAMANVFLGARTTPLHVTRKGIENMTPEMIRESNKKNKRIRLIARAWNDSGSVRTMVQPEYLPLKDLFSNIHGTGACLKIETDLMAPIMISQFNPTLKDTAFGVIEDLLTISDARRT